MNWKMEHTSDFQHQFWLEGSFKILVVLQAIPEKKDSD